MQQHIHIDEARIRAKAYELWQARGCPEGSGDRDWIEAERLLRAELDGAEPGEGALVAEEPEEPEEPPVAVRVPPVALAPTAKERRATSAAARPVEAEPAREFAPEELTVPSAGVVISSPRSRDARGTAAAAAPVTLRGVGDVASKRKGAVAPDRRADRSGPVSGGTNGRASTSSARKGDGKPDAKRKPGRGR